MKATLETHNQSPRKVRLVTDLVKGKTYPAALAALAFLPKRAASPVKKLLESAAANAREQGAKLEELTVKSLTVESAGMVKRYLPRMGGRASLIRRRRSRVIVELGSAEARNPKHEARNKA